MDVPPDPSPHGARSTYLPVDAPKLLAEDVWIVDSGPLGGILPLPLRMTVIRLPGGNLLLHSPTRLTAPLRDAIDRIGPVGFLFAPNIAHWMFLRDWQRAYPAAQTWAAPGLRKRRAVRRAAVTVDHELSDIAPSVWGGAIHLVVMPGGFGFREIALFHLPSRTLVLTDLVLNLEPTRLPAPARAFAMLAGMNGRAPIYLRALVKLAGAPAARAAAALVALRPDRVVFAHGRMFEQDATAALERSLGWLLSPSRHPTGVPHP